jgi:hypothetical protein
VLVMGDRGRQRDPQPLNRQGEVALVALSGVVYAVTWVALGGLGLAAGLFGGGWFLPSGNDMVPVMVGLLSGHPGQGLPPDLAARLPGTFAVYGCVAVVEVAAIAAAIVGGVLVARYRRPGDARRGMATRYEAAQVLGIGRLRSARAVIRPDLATLRSRWRPAAAPATAPAGHRDARSTS